VTGTLRGTVTAVKDMSRLLADPTIAAGSLR
jgi:hypothetical protein